MTVAALLWIAAGCSLPLLARLVRAARQTTLLAPWCWAAAACAALVAMETTMLTTQPTADVIGMFVVPSRFVIALLALCPTISVLGAKRPQHRAWQFVVLAFVLVLLIPVARGLFLHPGMPNNLHLAQQIFLHLIALMGVVNWIATRYGLAAVLAGLAQWILIQPRTWSATAVHLSDGWTGLLHPLVAGALATTALAIVACIPRRPMSADRAWLDFRDQLGLFWSARVLSRLNAAAAEKHWPVRLTWHGFESLAPVSPPDNPKREPGNKSGSPKRERGDRANDPALQASPIARRTLRMLLLRFVSTEWLAARPDGG